MSGIGTTIIPALVEAVRGLITWFDTNLPNIKAAWQTLKDGIAEILAAVGAEILPGVQTAIEGFRDWFNSPEGAAAISAAFDGIKEAAGVMKDSIIDVVIPQLKNEIASFELWLKQHGDSINTTFWGVRDAAKTVVDFIQGNWETISTVMSAVIEQARKPLGMFIGIIGNLFDATSGVIDLIRGNWPDISTPIHAVWNRITGPLGAMKSAFEKIAGAIQWALDKLNAWNRTTVKPKVTSTPSVLSPHSPVLSRALGGPIPGTGPIPITAHGGEYVLTKGDTELMRKLIASGRGGGGDITINVSGAGNPEQVAERVYQKLRARRLSPVGVV
jgi:phage-related protein